MSTITNKTNLCRLHGGVKLIKQSQRKKSSLESIRKIWKIWKIRQNSCKPRECKLCLWDKLVCCYFFHSPGILFQSSCSKYCNMETFPAEELINKTKYAKLSKLDTLCGVKRKLSEAQCLQLAEIQKQVHFTHVFCSDFQVEIDG